MNFDIAHYLHIRTASYPAFAADGQHITFLADITGTSQLWQLETTRPGQPVAWPNQLTFDADRVLSVSHSPVPGDSRLIYSHDLGGNESMQLSLLDTATGQEQRLTTGHDAVMHLFGDWSADGSHILFAANRLNPGRFDLYWQPLAGEARLVWQNDAPGYLFEAILAPDQQTVFVTRHHSSFEVDMLQIDLGEGSARRLNPSAEGAWYGELNLSPEGDALYFLTDFESDTCCVMRRDLQSGRQQRLIDVDWDVELLQLSPDGRFLAYTVNQGGVSVLELLDLGKGIVRSPVIGRDETCLVGWLDSRLAFSADGRQLLFSFTSASRSSDIFVWPLAQDRATAVTRSDHGGIPREKFVSPTLIDYPTFDDRRIPAWYYQPVVEDPAQRLPVVIIVHGGPESQFRPYFNFLAQYLVHNGYAVLGPNVRGSVGYGKLYAGLDDVEKRLDSVADLAQAAHWLKAQPEIDPERIIVYGGSYGGFMVLAALTHHPDLWAAGVDIVGMSNLVTFLENTSDYRRAHREAEYGSLARDRDFLESTAPINHIDKLNVPLQVIHGANDPRVPLSEAEQLVATLEARGVPVEFLVFDDEGHGIKKLHNKLVLYPAIIRFMNSVGQ